MKKQIKRSILELTSNNYYEGIHFNNNINGSKKAWNKKGELKRYKIKLNIQKKN